MWYTADTLAYLTAKTHGLEEEAESIAASLGQSLDEVMSIIIRICTLWLTKFVWQPEKLGLIECAYKTWKCFSKFEFVHTYVCIFWLCTIITNYHTLLYLVQLPAVKSDAKLLLPPVPVQQMQANWPLLTVSKGFFESAMSAKGLYFVCISVYVWMSECVFVWQCM